MPYKGTSHHTPMTTLTTTTPLTGPELLEKVKEMGNCGKHELAKACGYSTDKSNGGERTNFNSFYMALLEAKGISIGTYADNAEGARGKTPSFITTVHFNGNLMVGRAYMKQLGYQPGDQFQIKLTKRGIRLIPLNQPEDDDGQEFSD